MQGIGIGGQRSHIFYSIPKIQWHRYLGHYRCRFFELQLFITKKLARMQVSL